MNTEIREGDRVTYSNPSAAKHYDPGVGTVMMVTANRVGVLWDKPSYRALSGRFSSTSRNAREATGLRFYQPRFLRRIQPIYDPAHALS